MKSAHTATVAIIFFCVLVKGNTKMQKCSPGGEIEFCFHVIFYQQKSMQVGKEMPTTQKNMKGCGLEMPEHATFTFPGTANTR